MIRALVTTIFLSSLLCWTHTSANPWLVCDPFIGEIPEYFEVIIGEVTFSPDYHEHDGHVLLVDLDGIIEPGVPFDVRCRAVKGDRFSEWVEKTLVYIEDDEGGGCFIEITKRRHL